MAKTKKKKNEGGHSSVEEFRKFMNSTHGEGTLVCGEGTVTSVDFISTGSLSLDKALGIGGIPKARITEIYGSEGCGKTTLSLSIIASVQKAGGEAMFIDAEHALDPDYAKKIGVDMTKLVISQPSCGEQALNIANEACEAGLFDLIVVDSVAALVPKAEIEGEVGDNHMGAQARMMSQALRKLAPASRKGKTALIFINQIREKIGVMFGNPETTSGGRALKFYASVRIDVRRQSVIKSGDEAIGHTVVAKTVKNKVASPFKKTEFDIIWGEGISLESDILSIGEEVGIIQKKGSNYYYNNNKFGTGRANAIDTLKRNKSLSDSVVKDIQKTLSGKDTNDNKQLENPVENNEEEFTEE